MRHLPYNNCLSQHEYQDRNLKTQNGFKEKNDTTTAQAELEKIHITILPFRLH
jgi:hypothetical protein